MTVKVLFVCLGNICRSPTAEGIFAHRLQEAGLQQQVEIDSAGTSDWHIGKAPDARSIAAANARGYAIDHLRGRQAIAEDFARFDYILAMDTDNLALLQRLQPPGWKGRLGLFLEFAGDQAPVSVPDPYYGGEEGFQLVLDLLEEASDGLLADIRKHHLS